MSKLTECENEPESGLSVRLTEGEVLPILETLYVTVLRRIGLRLENKG
jgi:hypothetical protein